MGADASNMVMTQKKTDKEEVMQFFFGCNVCLSLGVGAVNDP